MSADTRLHTTEQLLNESREENKSLRSKLDQNTLRLSQCDQELAHASEQLASLSDEVALLNMTKDRLNSTEAEKGILKGDIARLIRMLENYPAAKGFLKKWKESDGLSFLGVGPINEDDQNTTTPNSKSVIRQTKKSSASRVDISNDTTTMIGMLCGVVILHF